MLLSVIVYNHKLTPGQWVGAGVVFAGISVEAFVKRKGQQILRLHGTQTNAYKNRCTCQTRDPREGKGKDQVSVMQSKGNMENFECIYLYLMLRKEDPDKSESKKT